jgi:hypothetical protein
MGRHPILVPQPFGGPVAVRWLADEQGVCHGMNYYNSNKDCRASLLALAKQVALTGKVIKVPENGHRLQGEFGMLLELKPGDHRFLAFRHGANVYITNGAPKKKPSRQIADYRVALGLREAFLQGQTK